MDNNDEGQVVIDGVNIADYNQKQMTAYRRNDKLALSSSFIIWYPNLTAKENVELASEIVSHAKMQKRP